MAAASVLTPSSHYQTPSFAASTYPPQLSGPSPAPAMISTSEPRLQPVHNTNDAPARQSLPSVSEVISGACLSQYAPHDNSMPPQPSSGSLPSLSAPPSRQYPDSDQHSHSSQPLRPASFPLSQDTDRRSVSGGYPLPHAATSHPGQMPLSVYAISPGHEHYDDPHPRNRGEPGPSAGRRYEPAPRHYENWTYQESFSRIGTHSYSILNFAEAYGRAAQEQQGGSPPERLPSEREVNEMFDNVDYIKRSLAQVRDIVQDTKRAREGAKAKGVYEESHDVNMYNDGMQPHYPVTKVKKSRRRAAPPGRCHSCKRIDTPEWRRGPDGARTLCNACGLQHAKLLKRQLEARALRLQTEERN